MDLLEQTKKLCDTHNIRPSRSKGQNFLADEAAYDKVVDAAELSENDIVLEVGPGFGFLTEKLAKKVKKVIAIELDDKLAAILKGKVMKQGLKNVEVINADILSYELRVTSYKVAANLPYNITSIFLRKFLSAHVKPNSMTLMLQKEVAERICARPPKMSLLAVSVQFYAEPEIVDYVSADNFWPRPEVDSAIVHLIIREKKELNSLASKELSSFFRLVKAGFSARRKMLKNNLAAFWRIEPQKAEKVLEQAGFNGKARAQELSVADWLKLFEILG